MFLPLRKIKKVNTTSSPSVASVRSERGLPDHLVLDCDWCDEMTPQSRSAALYHCGVWIDLSYTVYGIDTSEGKLMEE